MIAILYHRGSGDWWQEVVFVLSQVGIAMFQAGKFAANVAISHTFWAVVVAAEIILLSCFSKRKWAMAATLVLERIIVFNPVINLIRKKPFFYVNSWKHGSWMDKYLPKGYYPYLFVAACIALLCIKLIHHKH